MSRSAQRGVVDVCACMRECILDLGITADLLRLAIYVAVPSEKMPYIGGKVDC